MRALARMTWRRSKERLAEKFGKVFTGELQEKGCYEIVDKADKDVLIVRPSIVNLNVPAPETVAAPKREIQSRFGDSGDSFLAICLLTQSLFRNVGY